MTTPVQPTTTINVDDAVFEVARMSAEIQQTVRLFDECRQVEADATFQVLMARNALTNLQNTLLQAIQKEREEATKKAEAMGLVPAPAVPAAPAPAPVPAKKARKGAAQ
jgi:plasmid replication initiation protein